MTSSRRMLTRQPKRFTGPVSAERRGETTGAPVNQPEPLGGRRCIRGHVVAEVQHLLDGLSFGESLRWHQDRLWLADWGAQEVMAVDRAGRPEVMARVDFPAFPMCIDWLPDGRLLIVAARDGRLLRQEPDGSLVTHADLRGLAEPGHPWNEIVVDGRGNAYLNNQGSDFPGGHFAPGMIALLTPDGSARPVADGTTRRLSWPSPTGRS